MTDQRNYWNRMADYGASASVIDPHDRHGHKNCYIQWLRDQVFLDLVASSNKPARILDFGCGSGNISSLLAEYGHDVIGIDISVKLLNLANECEIPNKPGFACYDGSRLPVRSGSMDVVTTYVVLGHIIDDAALSGVLGELHRCLKPGGRLIAIEQTRKQQKLTDNGYKRQRRKGEYIALFSDSGFSVTDSFSVRSGHMPLIYMVQSGLLRKRAYPLLSKIERRLCRASNFLGDYIDTVFVLAKPPAHKPHG
ncbi:MAG: methyltransferase domain-containing protein [bacterium]